MNPTIPNEAPFASLAALTRSLQATSKRLEKRALLVEFLRALRRDEVAAAVHLIVGHIFAEADERTLNVGWATLRKALAATRQTSLAAEPLTILEVSRAFAQIAAARGTDSTKVRRRILEALLGRASEEERKVILRIVFGEMRIGVNEGVMLDAIADASAIDPERVRSAQMFLDRKSVV